MSATVVACFRSKLITEGAGVKVVMTEPPEVERDLPTIGHQFRTSVVLDTGGGDDCGENRKSCGFHLSRSKWDPYPWVGYVETGSIADLAGLR